MYVHAGFGRHHSLSLEAFYEIGKTIYRSIIHFPDEDFRSSENTRFTLVSYADHHLRRATVFLLLSFLFALKKMLDLGAEGGKFAIDRRQLLVDFEGHNGGFLFGQDLLAYGIAELK